MGCCVCLFDSSHPPPACPFCFSDYTYHSEEEVEDNDMMVEKEKGSRESKGGKGWEGGEGETWVSLDGWVGQD